jgi:apolipoprotein N-acyltransferase
MFISFSLTSPKWGIALAPWLAYTAMIRFFRQNELGKSIWLGWGVSYLAALIASWEVVPVPFPILLIFSLVSTGLLLIPYVLDRWLHRKFSGWHSTLVFPTAMVLMDFLASKGGGGTWGNIAYLQFSNNYLMQLASVTGIWGISFMVYWFASTVNHVYETSLRKQFAKTPLVLYGSTLLLVLSFGFIRVLTSDPEVPKIRMAGITVENIAILETVHACNTGETIKIPTTAHQSDSELAKAMRSMESFVAYPNDPKFAPVFKEIDAIMEKLWESSRQAVKQGAKVLVWTEGIVNAIKSDESKYIEAAKEFAGENQIWLFYPMATIIPGEITPGKPFIENKVLTIDPSGQVVNTYFKNIPVGGVEPSFPGDGTVPIIPTPFADISPVICYDADFPQLLQQVGQQSTEVLVVPSGDWHAIAPIHSYMAVVRAIENGVSILRPVSKGLTLAADKYGRIIAEDNYFEDDQHLLVADIPVKKSTTIYSIIGDLFVYCCGTVLLLLITLGIVYK